MKTIFSKRDTVVSIFDNVKYSKNGVSRAFRVFCDWCYDEDFENDAFNKFVNNIDLNNDESFVALNVYGSYDNGIDIIYFAKHYIEDRKEQLEYIHYAGNNECIEELHSLEEHESDLKEGLITEDKFDKMVNEYNKLISLLDRIEA